MDGLEKNKEVRKMGKYDPWAHTNGENYDKFGITDPYTIILLRVDVLIDI